MSRLLKTIIIINFTIANLIAQTSSKQNDFIWLHPNNGQWDENIIYKVDLHEGDMFITNNSFTYSLDNLNKIMSHHHNHNHGVEIESTTESLEGQIIRSTFINSSWEGRKTEKNQSDFYENYFLGNDPNKWKSNIFSFGQTTLHNYYPSVDLLIDGKDNSLKYSFIAQPHADVSKIRYQISGANKIYIDSKGDLHILHRFGEIIEKKPIAWNSNAHQNTLVDVQFGIEGNDVYFIFPNDYNHNQELVIDPVLVFSSFTGSTADNWGLSACPDLNGNLYAGGVVSNLYGGSYPTTTGAFDISYNGGIGSWPSDASISKFNSTGTSLIYSTYLGGSKNESLSSLVCDQNGELYILGMTSSSNFPISTGAFDVSFNGGPNVENTGIYHEGVDIFITHFNANGTDIIGSTYLGGTNTDGTSAGNGIDGPLSHSYGDDNRGEIIVDNSNNVYIVSTSKSSDFPIVNGSQANLTGGQDAIVAKFNSTLSSIIWSTFFGGAGLENGNSIQLSNAGHLYIAGGSTSQTLPSNTGDDLSYNGGEADGYLAKFNSNNGAVEAATFIGQNQYDQAFCVQLDIDNYVYVLGQTETSFPITAGRYGVPNSGQFIRKYSEDLIDIKWTTMIGGGGDIIEIQPTAFMVSDCFDIYLAGWGHTGGFPTTPDAFQPTTNGDNFYLALLSPDATSLKYATFMGGITSWGNHVDGGTSRFDKKGYVYHAACAACGGNPNGFTTTPGVFSTTNNSDNCNLAAFKFDMSIISTIVVEPTSSYCYPDSVQFEIDTTMGNTFFWDFGDGTFSNEENPSHLYNESGVYTVTLIVNDSINCVHDTISLQVNYYRLDPQVIQPSEIICPNTSYQLQASGGINYLWSPTSGLNDPTIANPIATITQTTQFSIIISDSCSSDTLFVTLEVDSIVPVIITDSSVCEGNSIQLFVTNGISHLWSPSASLNDPTIANPIASPTESTTYTVEVTTQNNCVFHDTVEIEFKPLPHPVMEDIIDLCVHDTVSIEVSGGDVYSWSPNSNINTLLGNSVNVHPLNSMYYYCDFSTECGTERDSVLLNVHIPNITASNDTTICPADLITIYANGGVSYVWYEDFSFPNSVSQQVHPSFNTEYYVIGTDQYGCVDTAYVQVDVYPMPYVKASKDVEAFYDELIPLSATGNLPGEFYWSPIESLTCSNCPSTLASPNTNTIYTVTFVDTNSCKAEDQVTITYKPLIYIPNTFTPDGNSFNDVFSASGENIKSFGISIYDRWGEEVFTSNSLTDSWDGTYKNMNCQEGTYVWKVVVEDLNEMKQVLVGHVNLLK